MRNAQKIIVEVKQYCKNLFIFIFQFNFLYKSAKINLTKAETLQLRSTLKISFRAERVVFHNGWYQKAIQT